MRFDAVIFDIDNVLVDTRASYTDSIRKTVQTYLENVLKFTPSKKTLLSRKDVEQFKSLGGFNDDWDTCHGLLLYLLSLPVKECSIQALAKGKDFEAFGKRVKKKPLGLLGLVKLIGSKPSISLEQITDIFQRFYLGGFTWNERLLIPKTFLKRLKRNGLKLGIVTGRNNNETYLALRRFQIEPLIDARVTLDDTPKNRKKPDPYGLLKIAHILGKDLRYLYVGDLPDDIIASERAKKIIKIKSLGFLRVAASPQEMKSELRKSGADFVCQTSQELLNIILT